jgi:integrase
MKLTEKGIAGLSCAQGRKDRLVFDDTVPGLAVRVGAGGAKTFLVQYSHHGRKRRVPIGRWGAVTLEQARATARGVLGDVAKGRDPAAERVKSRALVVAQAAAERLTLARLVDEWAEIALTARREGYRREAVRAIKVAFAGVLDRPASAMTRSDAVNVLDRMVRAGRAAMAGRTLAYGRACFGWAVRRGKTPDNPFNGLPIATGSEARDRVLTDAETGAIWRAAGQMGWPFGPLVRLLFLTAQRRDEVAHMRCGEIAPDQSVWTIPKERLKSGRAHVVHLAPEARAVLAEVPRLDGCDLVFSTNRQRPVSGFTKAKERLDRLSGVADWRLHDIRRTAVSWMAGAGFSPLVADLVLAHATLTNLTTVGRVYQRAEMLPERKAALEAWAAHVLRCAEGRLEAENVIELARRR